MHMKIHHKEHYKTDQYKKPVVEVRELQLGEEAIWRCPIDGCRFGIAKELLHVGNEKIHRKARSKHRKDHHPRVSKKAWRIKLSTHARSGHARKHRVTMFNLGAARRFGTQLVDDQWEHFTRPQVTRKKKLGPRFGLRKTWRCKYCLSTTLSAAAVRNHVCHVVSEAFVAKAINALERHRSTVIKLLQKGSECFNAEQINRIFNNAVAEIEGDSLQS